MNEDVKIRVEFQTREALKAMGRKGETYDAVIRRLIEHYAKDFVSALGESLLEITDIEKEADGNE